MPKEMTTVLALALLALACAGPLRAARPQIAIPQDFPTFAVPGQEGAMAELRELFWVHYERGGPLATLWDEWMSTPTLWPAVSSDNRMNTIRERWRETLLGRGMDAEGYVFTHQHGSIAHQEGWPFPFWKQGRGWGWHFSLQDVPPGWHGSEERDQAGWGTRGVRDGGKGEGGWQLELVERQAAVTTPELAVSPEQAPFVQVRWQAEGLGLAQPYLQWTTEQEPEFAPERTMYLAPAGPGPKFTYTMVPLYRHPAWRGTITRLRLCFGNPEPGGRVVLQAVFTNYDTRHTINNQNFIRGSINYFRWSGDVDFLRRNLGRMRLALSWLMTELGGLEQRCIVVPWVGHDGRPGFTVKANGEKEMHSGRGIGNNYWDLLPMGYRDAYATIHYYSALLAMAGLEREIAQHPEWNLPGGPLRLDPEALARHAREVKEQGGKIFWNAKTRRFTTGPDIDGRSYDYGFVFLNLEAICYDFATPEQARDILSWITGERLVAGDTSQGKDIYHWRFGPRSTTRRNMEYYLWAWSAPESIPWGGQVQDGGAVLGFSYHDLLARLRVLGPDSCWQRLREVVDWYREVQEAGGPRAYYQDGSRGTLQGGGTAGGLGVDMEFFESILVPQIISEGFLGLRARVDGISLAPRLPRDWPSLGVAGIYWHDLVFDVEATPRQVSVTTRERRDRLACIGLPEGRWSAALWDGEGKRLGQAEPRREGGESVFYLNWGQVAKATFSRAG